MVSYINRKVAMTSPDVLFVELGPVADDPGSFSVSMHRMTLASDNWSEIKIEADNERMTLDGAKSRVEAIARRHGIPVCQTDGTGSEA